MKMTSEMEAKEASREGGLKHKDRKRRDGHTQKRGVRRVVVRRLGRETCVHQKENG